MFLLKCSAVSLNGSGTLEEQKIIHRSFLFQQEKEALQKQLEEANREAQKYRQQLLKKEQEAEAYRQKLEAITRQGGKKAA